MLRARAAVIVAAVVTLAVACRHSSPVPRTPAIPMIDEAEAAAAPNPHDHRGKPLCQRCHLADGALRADPVALCAGCHAHGHANHPVDVVQASQPGLPLLSGGRVACHTCHDPHDVRRERGGLRMEADALCVRCHRGH